MLLVVARCKERFRVRFAASFAMAAAHLEGVRARLGPSSSVLQARPSVFFWVALLQEQLVEYVARLKDLAAASGEHRTFDVRAVEKLMLDTPRIVQKAILQESHHCGHSHAKYPGSL